jgi:hypothetical protein
MRLRSATPEMAWDTVVRAELVLLAVLAPLYPAASLSEELESGTMSYLWSRPLERWAVAAGKLLAMAPIVAAIVVGSATAATLLASDALPPLTGVFALLLGSATLCLAATGLALWVPRHGLVVPMGYLLFIDVPVGELPMTLVRASMTHHVRVLAGVTDGSAGEATLWLLALTALWLVLGLRRLRDLE